MRSLIRIPARAVTFATVLGLLSGLAVVANAASSEPDTLVRTNNPERYQISISASSLKMRARIGDSLSIFFAAISASVFSESGACARPVGAMVSGSHPARVIAAATAADASSARAKGRFKPGTPRRGGPSLSNRYP